MKVEVDRALIMEVVIELDAWARECVDIATYMVTDEEQEAYYDRANDLNRIRQALFNAVNAADGGGDLR